MKRRKLPSDIGPYAIVPQWIHDYGISDRAFRLYYLLALRANDRHVAWPSRRWLGMELQCSVASIDRALEELRNYGALDIQDRQRQDGGQSSNLYHIHFLPMTMRTPLFTGEEGGGNHSQVGALLTDEQGPSSPVSTQDTEAVDSGFNDSDPPNPHEVGEPDKRSPRAKGTNPRALATAQKQAERESQEQEIRFIDGVPSRMVDGQWQEVAS